jgi:GNAT superfamily N-acetyltransferase
LILEGLGEHFGFIDEPMNPDIDDIHHHYIRADDTFIVAVHGGEIVGAVALLAECETVGRLVRMSVSSAWRQRGITTALVGHLIAAAQERGFFRIILAVQVPWIEAIGFYESCGFAEYGRDEVHVHMELRLV